MNSISLTIPLDDYDALNRASDMLHGLAVDLINKTKGVQGKGNKFTEQEIFDRFHAEGEPEQSVTTAKPNAVTELKQGSLALVGNNPIDTSEGVGVGNLPINAGVELDSEGLPHDLRIHGAKRLKTAKDNVWKKIRGVDPALVATVEAELRSAMNASADNPIAPAPAPVVDETPEPPTPLPVVDETPEPALYLVNGNSFTADQLKTAGWSDEQIASCDEISNASAPVKKPAPMTFPEFMAKLNPALAAGTITQPIVDAALNKQGLASLPLLSARPDLIPKVMVELF